MELSSNQTVVLSMIIMKLRLLVEQNDVSLVAIADTCMKFYQFGVRANQS